MRGLLLNNFYSMEKGIRQSFIITIAAVALLLLAQNPLGLRAATFLPFLLIPINALEVLKHDRLSGWDKFEVTLPVSREKIIRSKYLTFLILLVASAALLVVLFTVSDFAIAPSLDATFVNFTLRGIGIVLCIAAATFFLTYMLGAEKSDTITLMSGGFGIAVFFLVSSLLPGLIGTGAGYDRIFSISLVLIAGILFVISYILSVILYKRKEF